MRLPDWTTRHPLAASLACCVLLGLVAGWLSTPLPDTGTLRNTANAWKLPTSAQLSRFDEKTFLDLQRSAVWNSVAAESGARGIGSNTRKPTWSLVGVVLEPQPVALVLNTASAQVDRVGVGANLPDGSRVEKIQHDSISVFADGCSTRVDVFRTRESAANKTCKGDAASAQPKTAGNRDD